MKKLNFIRHFPAIKSTTIVQHNFALRKRILSSSLVTTKGNHQPTYNVFAEGDGEEGFVLSLFIKMA